MRGRDPDDETTFHPRFIPAMRAAVEELSWLLGRAYSPTAAVALVGDQHQLTAGQRKAVRTCSVGNSGLQRRFAREVHGIVGERVVIDGFNVLITLERALAGSPVLVGRDGVVRDIAAVHKTYRPAAVTPMALALAGEILGRARAVLWLFDQAVSNSGRLATQVESFAEQRGWAWEARAAVNPESQIVNSPGVVITSDGWILENCGRWYNLVLRALPPGTWRVDLGSERPVFRAEIVRD